MTCADTQRYHHQPALARQVLEAVAPRPGGRYVDCTLGEGGHAALIYDASRPGGRLLGIDADPQALESARRRLDDAGNIVLVQGNFARVAEIARDQGFAPVDGVLFDLGLSSLQLEGETRGFTFQHDQPLDMRFDPRQDLTATVIINTWPEQAIANLIWSYGEERRSRAIARAIVRQRPVHTAGSLARIVREAAGPARGRIHPATRTFQALRIAVNQELEVLEPALEGALDVLRPGGRLVVISYHSLEDRRVKGFFRQESSGCSCPAEQPSCTCRHEPRLRLVYKKALLPTRQEIEMNRRSRSARLRVAERV